MHDIPWWYAPIRPQSFDNRFGHIVLISEERKKYLELYVQRHLLSDDKDKWDEEDVNILGSSRVLGEYRDGEITLYINSIKDVAMEGDVPLGVLGKSYLTVLRHVYLHELMHAFFDREGINIQKSYNRKSEEGFAEFGALLFLNQLVNTDPNRGPKDIHATKEELDWATGFVESKSGPLSCYAQGAVLFKQYGNDKSLCKKMLEAFPNSAEQ